jgi:hypothetical protein
MSVHDLLLMNNQLPSNFDLPVLTPNVNKPVIPKMTEFPGRIICKCGAELSIYSLSRHLKTECHKEAMVLLNRGIASEVLSKGNIKKVPLEFVEPLKFVKPLDKAPKTKPKEKSGNPKKTRSEMNELKNKWVRKRVICECGMDVAKGSLSSHKRHSLHKQNMEKKTKGIKPTPNTRLSEKVKCECGVEICKKALRMHMKSESHKLYVEKAFQDRKIVSEPRISQEYQEKEVTISESEKKLANEIIKLLKQTYTFKEIVN